MKDEKYLQVWGKKIRWRRQFLKAVEKWKRRNAGEFSGKMQNDVVWSTEN